MGLSDLHIDADRLADICRRYQVARLEAFGSFVSGDAAADYGSAGRLAGRVVLWVTRTRRMRRRFLLAIARRLG